MPNINMLEGMRCPKCGSEGPFVIHVDLYVLVHDDGWSDEDIVEDPGLDSGYCCCNACDYSGYVHDFEIENQESDPIPEEM